MRIHVVSAAPMSEAQKDRLRRLGELHYYDALMGDRSIAAQVRGAEILVTTPRLPLDITPHLDRCRFISVQATGVDALNLAACREKGIVVSNVPGFSTDAVAEHAFALLLCAAKRIEEGRAVLHAGSWTRALAFATAGLRGKVLGLFGCGQIGGRIAQLGRAFGMDAMAVVRDPSKPRSVPTVSFSELLERADFIVVAAPATPGAPPPFDSAAFVRMKPSAILVNISRGALVNEEDLLAALDAGALAAAATDVFREEPPRPDDPLLHHPRLAVSPHSAWGVAEAVQLVLDESILNVEAFLAGEPRNVVSGP